MERVFESSKNSETEQIDAVRKYWEHEKFLNMLNASDPFVGRNALGVRYSETPCWFVLAMPVPELLSDETQERRRADGDEWLA